MALAGDSADIHISGVDFAAVHAGSVLCHPDFPVHLAYKFTVQVLVLQIPVPILKGHAVTIHAHTAREAGVISGLLGLCDSKTGQHRQHKPRCLLGGQVRQAAVCVDGVIHAGHGLMSKFKGRSESATCFIVMVCS